MGHFQLDFVGVGTAKSGTTWLAQCLSEHPQVCMSDQKELNYFCTRHMWPAIATNSSEGKGWLRSRFSHCQEAQIRGEISPSYLVDAESARLIREHSPDTKIIFSYRDPTDALYSLYFQLAKSHALPHTSEQFVDRYRDYLCCGFYWTHTQRFLEFFPEESCHFILFDDICVDPERVMTDLFAFLGVYASYRPASLHRRVNLRKAPRSVLLRNVIDLIRVVVNRAYHVLPMTRVVRRIGLNRIGDWLLDKNLGEDTFPPMNADIRDRLQSLYAEENALLGQLLGRDLSQWNR